MSARSEFAAEGGMPDGEIKDPTDQRQSGRASTLVAGLIVLLIFLMPAGGFVWLRMMSRTAAESNTLFHTRDMLLRHFARTGGQWPQSWDDLQADFVPADANYGTPSLDALQQLVEVDFTFDVATLDDPALSADDFHVLWLKDRPGSELVASTNARLLVALRQRIESKRAAPTNR